MPKIVFVYVNINVRKEIVGGPPIGNLDLDNGSEILRLPWLLLRIISTTTYYDNNKVKYLYFTKLAVISQKLF